MKNWPQTNSSLRWAHQTFIVKPVGDLVADDDADAAVVERLGKVLAVEQRLQNSGGKHWKKSMNFFYCCYLATRYR